MTKKKTRRGLGRLLFWRRTKRKRDEKATAPRSDVDLICPVCWDSIPIENMSTTGSCEHETCLTCLTTYFRHEIGEGRVRLACPVLNCASAYDSATIARVLADEPSYREKYAEFGLRRALASTEPDLRRCPAPDCEYAVIASNCAGCPRLVCQRPGCGTEFCYHCKLVWHPDMTCDRNRTLLAGVSTENDDGDVLEEGGVGAARDSVIKPCPRCATPIAKALDGSCNHMTCIVCGAEFCWLCMKEISDLHYLSPSGCTFWGKKPWSRKKRILSQLATIVGAPLGIAVLAAIAGPALVVGLPAYFGHRAYEKKYKTPHRRNMAVAGAVGLSVVTSPLLAVVAIGIGVPILFGYVYGVVPVALCRSGNVRASAGGIFLDFNEDGSGEGGSGMGPRFGGRRLSISSVLMSGGAGTTSAQVHREAAV